MLDANLKVLLIIEQCNPDWPSVPLVGYRYYEEMSRLAQTTLVTHARNQAALEKKHPDRDMTYIAESEAMQRYYKLAARLTTPKGKVIWPLYNALNYPIYAEFNELVYQGFKDRVLEGEFDIVHAITPMMPRYPVKLMEACQNTPFVLGPVNGGVPFPPGFDGVARQEFAYFNFLRLVGRHVIPGYRTTYQNADRILAGSTYTLNLIQDLFQIEDQRIELFYENGITPDFLREPKDRLKPHSDRIHLLFVGRLVPYKGADMLIDAIREVNPETRAKLHLTIVGDGSERAGLEAKVMEFHLQDQVRFAGWVPQHQTLEYYRKADIFCFPSVREFGGAVVMEAMASGLPCIVVNNGGIGEYVTEGTGFKIDPLSRAAVVQELQHRIQQLVEDDQLRQSMSTKAFEKAREFVWETKAQRMMDIYDGLLGRTSRQGEPVRC
ncbi:MAG: glycosyltransferase family 4 protein [Leptolyngbyaceae cyanobacterium bins.59]|nr:glycosyltransferase family 4 protein [Leptolyngbyaceae cyanobacterium bins.59]